MKCKFEMCKKSSLLGSKYVFINPSVNQYLTPGCTHLRFFLLKSYNIYDNIFPYFSIAVS